MHSMFQIRISRNTRCAHKTGFPRPGHIFVLMPTGADPGGVMGVKRPPLPELYWESLKSGVVA